MVKNGSQENVFEEKWQKYCHDDWTVLPNMDAFPGRNVETMRLIDLSSGSISDLRESRRFCNVNGLGGFVTYKGKSYFRAEPAEELLGVAVHSTGSCLHACKPTNQQLLFNSDVASTQWYRSCGGLYGDDCGEWRTLRLSVLKGLPLHLATHVSELQLMRRLRLNTGCAVDYDEIADCLTQVFSNFDAYHGEISRLREGLLCVEEDAGAIVPVREACTPRFLVTATFHHELSNPMSLMRLIHPPHAGFWIQDLGCQSPRCWVLP